MTETGASLFGVIDAESSARGAEVFKTKVNLLRSRLTGRGVPMIRSPESDNHYNVATMVHGVVIATP